MNALVADYTYLQNTTWRLKAMYPFLQVKTIGKSVVGRSIYALEMGKDTAPCTILAGTFWGTDTTSGPLLLRFAEELLQAVANRTPVGGVKVAELFYNHKITIVPFMNPDGRDICEKGAHCGGVDSGRIKRLCGGDTTRWNANARGVEIARNFDFGFAHRRGRETRQGVYGPAPFGYSGHAPETEPETVALANYCRQQKTRLTIAFYPGSGEIYWRNRSNERPEAKRLGELLALTAGYDAEAEIGPLTDSGFRNWVAFATRGFSVDCTLPQADAPQTDSTLEEMLVTACLFGQ